MKILGVSTATNIASMAIIDEKSVLFECSYFGLKSENITNVLNDVMIKSALNSSDIEGIGVTIGPGSYSGLRGGLSAAKSLAMVLNIPLSCISTLESVAYNMINSCGSIIVLQDAIKGESNIAVFASDGIKMKRLTEDFVIKNDNIETVLSKFEGKIYLIGVNGYMPVQISNKNIIVAEPVNSMPRGVNVASLANNNIKAGIVDDVMRVSPKYSYMPNAREYKNAN